jgi:hypothetical protein
MHLVESRRTRATKLRYVDRERHRHVGRGEQWQRLGGGLERAPGECVGGDTRRRRHRRGERVERRLNCGHGFRLGDGDWQHVPDL